MSDQPDIEAIADGLALWQEHKPQSAEDWLRIASRMDADGYETPNASPLFAALRLAVQERDSNEMDANMTREALDAARDRVGEVERENEQLREALSFYGDRESWRRPMIARSGDAADLASEIDKDEGKLARAALAGTPEQRMIAPRDGWRQFGCPECGGVFQLPSDRADERPWCMHNGNYRWAAPSFPDEAPGNSWAQMVPVVVAALAGTEEAPRVLCDACNVRPDWPGEHRCCGSDTLKCDCQEALCRLQRREVTLAELEAEDAAGTEEGPTND